MRIGDFICAAMATFIVGSIGVEAAAAEGATAPSDQRASTAAETSQAEHRYVARLRLPAGGTAVIAEGDLEARSMGSYSVRLYASDGAPAVDDTALYRSGIILERNGTIEDVRLADINGKSGDELVIIIRSARSGDHRSAQALSIANNQVEALAKVVDLPADADPIAALEKTARSDKLKGRGKFHDPNSGAR